MKYKVGDKVRVRKDIKEHETYGSYLTCNDSMVKKAGLVVTIKECDNVYKRYKIDADDWNWCDEMFEGLVGMQSAKLIEKLEENQVFVMNDRPQRPTKPASTPDDKAKGSHYEKAAMQPLEVMQRIMTKEQFKGFLLGNCIKYRMRSDYKGQHDSDEYKARQYAYWLELVDMGQTINPTKDKVPDSYKFKVV